MLVTAPAGKLGPSGVRSISISQESSSTPLTAMTNSVVAPSSRVRKVVGVAVLSSSMSSSLACDDGYMGTGRPCETPISAPASASALSARCATT